METLPLFAFVGALLLLALLSMRFGYDSRDGFSRPPEGPLWRRPEGEQSPARGRREIRATQRRVGGVAIAGEPSTTLAANGGVAAA
jgi:hypothetical protein